MALSKEEAKKIVRESHPGEVVSDGFWDFFWEDYDNQKFSYLDLAFNNALEADFLKKINLSVAINAYNIPYIPLTYNNEIDKENEKETNDEKRKQLDSCYQYAHKEAVKIQPNTTMTPEADVEIFKSKAARYKEESSVASEATGVAINAEDVINNAMSISTRDLHLKLAGGMHIVNLVTSAVSVLTIPGLYIYQLVRGQKPSFNLTNNAKWAAGAILLTVAIVGIAVPPLGVAMLVAGSVFSAGVAVVSFANMFRERKKLEVGLAKIDKDMLEIANEMKKIREQAKNLNVTNNKAELVSLCDDYEKAEKQLKLLASKHKTISDARKDMATPFDKALNIAGIVLGVIGIAAAILAFPWAAPVVASGIFIGLAVVGVGIVGVAASKFITDYRAKKKGVPELMVKPTIDEQTIEYKVGFTAELLRKLNPDSQLGASQPSHQECIKALEQQLKARVQEATAFRKPSTSGLTEFFNKFEEEVVEFQKSHPTLKKSPRLILDELPADLVKDALAALPEAKQIELNSVLKSPEPQATNPTASNRLD